MLDPIVNGLLSSGPWGLMLLISLTANVAQWQRDDKRWSALLHILDEFRELSVQSTAAMVEWSMLARHDKR